MYEPNFSYSTTSNFDVDNLLTLVNRDELLKRYIKARDTAHAVEEKYFEEDKAVIQACIDSFDDVRLLIHDQLPEMIQNHLKAVEFIQHHIQSIINMRSKINHLQAFTVRKNFRRGVQAMDEKTFSVVASDYSSFVYTFEHQLQSMVNAKTEDSRTILRDLLRISIGARKQLTQNALANITEARTAYLTGKGIFDYPLGRVPIVIIRKAVPAVLLRTAIERPGTSRFYLNRSFEDLRNLIRSYDNMDAFVNLSYNSRKLDYDRMSLLLNNFSSESRRFLGSRSNVLDDVFAYPTLRLEARKEEWVKLIEEFKKFFQEISVNLKNLIVRCKEIQETAWVNSTVAMDHAREYLIDQSHGKTALASIITDSALQEAVTKLDLFFREIRTRTQSLHDNWDKFIDSIVNIWRYILHTYYADSKPYLEFKRHEWANMKYEVVKNRTIKDYRGIRARHDLIRKIQSRDHVFITSINKMMNLFKEYVDANVLDANFYR